MKFDVTQRPVEYLGRKPTDKPDKLRIKLCGMEVYLDPEMHYGRASIEQLHFFVVNWAKGVEAYCNDSADQILADMQRDSLAYCTGYHRGADVLVAVFKKILKRQEIQPYADLRDVLLQLVMTARDTMPAPNPDDAGFGRSAASEPSET